MHLKREHCINKFSKIFNLPLNDTIVLNLEKGIFNAAIHFCKQNSHELKWSNPYFFKQYAQLARKVIANLTYTSNAQNVKGKILDNVWLPETIATKTHEELNPEQYAELKSKIMSKYINTNTVEQEHDGFFKCHKCKSMKTTYTQAQTRSADEPMTTFVTCLNCDNRWKC